jgi:hypothetical protein
MSQPVSVSSREIQKVLDLLPVAGPAGLAPTSIAHVIGPPVTPEIVQDLMRRNGTGVLTRQPEEIANLIMAAKERGQEKDRQTFWEERS